MRFVLAAFVLASAHVMLGGAAWAQGPAQSYDPRAAFAQVDTNKDGQIDIEEFHVRLVEVFYNADTNKDGFLNADEYARLRPLAERTLTKTRSYLPLPGGLRAELDVFHGPLEGLAMVEVEFPDEAARAAFVPPPWFGRDVSQESWSANSWLAGKSLADVKDKLG